MQQKKKPSRSTTRYARTHALANTPTRLPAWQHLSFIFCPSVGPVFVCDVSAACAPLFQPPLLCCIRRHPYLSSDGVVACLPCTRPLPSPCCCMFSRWGGIPSSCACVRVRVCNPKRPVAGGCWCWGVVPCHPCTRPSHPRAVFSRRSGILESCMRACLWGVWP